MKTFSPLEFGQLERFCERKQPFNIIIHFRVFCAIPYTLRFSRSYTNSHALKLEPWKQCYINFYSIQGVASFNPVNTVPQSAMLFRPTSPADEPRRQTGRAARPALACRPRPFPPRPFLSSSLSLSSLRPFDCPRWQS